MMFCLFHWAIAWEGEGNRVRLESEDLPETANDFNTRSREAVVVTRFIFFILAAPVAWGAVESAPEVRVVGRRPTWVSPSEGGETSGESVSLDPSRTSGLTQAVARLPSIAVRRSGGEGSEPQFLIRGQDPHENRYFLEGVPLTDAEYQSSQLSAIPLEAVDRVDGFPSGVPVSLASDGIGGALHFRLPLAKPAPSAARLKVGAFGLKEAAASAYLTPSVRVSARGVLADEDFLFFDDNGTPFNPTDDRVERRAHNRFRRLSLLPTVSGKWGGAEVSGFALTSVSATEIPGPVSLPSSADLSDVFQVASASVRIGEWSAQGWFRGEWQRLKDPGRTIAANYALDKSAATAAGVSTRWDTGALGTTAAVAWDGFQVSGSDGYGAQRGRWQGTVGAVAQWRWDRITFTPGTTITVSHFPSGAGGVRNFTDASPRLGVVWNPTAPLRLRGTVGRYFRVPALAELHGSPSGLSPNGNLQEEVADKGEVGADLALHRHWKISYTASAAWARDLVTYLPNSQWSRVAVNVGRSRILTQELSAEGELPAGFTVGGQGVWMTTENRSPVAYWQGKELPYRPRWRGDFRAGWRSGKFRVGYQLGIWGALFEDLVNAKRRDAVTEHGFEVGWDGGGWGEWRVEGANLTDVTTAESNTGAFRTTENTTGYSGYPAPGRRLYLSWRYSL